MTTALPVSVAPRTGESIESWLEHLADANGLTTAQLLTTVRRGRASTRYLTLAPSPETVARLAQLGRVDEQAVYAATLAAFDGTALDLTGLNPHDRHSYRRVAARGWAPAHGTQICPTCLAETGAWQTAWRLLIVTTCTRHESLLVPRCPSCRRPFRDQRHSHLRRVGAATVCGNPLGAGPTQQCQHDPHHHPNEARQRGSPGPAEPSRRRPHRTDDHRPRTGRQACGIPERPAAPHHSPAPPRWATRRHADGALGGRPGRGSRCAQC